MAHKQLPWASWQHWEDARALLLGAAGRHDGSPAEQAARRLQDQWEGVNTVKAWRVRGKVPLSLDITAAIVEAQLQDQQQQQQACPAGTKTNSVSETMLRHQYALPLIRLVNGISDAQQRGRVAASVASLAQSAGLPAMLVDVRHAATHGELPSLAQLRLAASQAITWLQAAYWDSQAAQLTAQHARIASAIDGLQQSWQAAMTKNKPANSEVSAAGDEEDEEEETAAGTQAPAYSSAEGKQARKALLSQIKSLIPAAWSAALLQLVSAILGPQLCTLAPPFPTMLETGASLQVQPSAAEQGAAMEIAVGSNRKRKADQTNSTHDLVGCGLPKKPSDVASLKAVRACLLQLMKAYPYLGHQLLALCVHSLSSACCNAAPAQIRTAGHVLSSSQAPGSRQTCVAGSTPPHMQLQAQAASNTVADREERMLRRQAHQQLHAFQALLWWPQQLILHTQMPSQPVAASQPEKQQNEDAAPFPNSTEALGQSASKQGCLPIETAWAWLNLLLPPAPTPRRPSKHAKLSSASKLSRSEHTEGDANDDDEDGGAVEFEGQAGALAAGGSNSPPTASLPLSLSAAQMVELLGITLQGLSAWHHAGRQGTTSNTHTADQQAALLCWVAKQLSAHLASLCASSSKAQWGPGGPALARTLLQLAQLLPLGTSDDVKAKQEQASILSVEEAAAKQAQLLASSWPTSQDRHSKPAVQQGPAGQLQPGGTRNRWQRAPSWQPCALGSLPAACLPSGLPSLLVDPCALPVLLPAPESNDNTVLKAYSSEALIVAEGGNDDAQDMLDIQERALEVAMQLEEGMDVDPCSSRVDVESRQRLLQVLSSQVVLLC